MRWFKHMSASLSDEKIARLIDRGGLQAYGLYWAVVETVASHMDKNGAQCSVRYPLSKWAAVLHVRPQNVYRQLAVLAAAGLLELTSDEAGIELHVPKLLKYRDEYSRKSGESQESVRSKIHIQRQNTDRETYTDTDKGMEGRTSTNLRIDPVQESQKQPPPVPASASAPADNPSSHDHKNPHAEQLATFLLTALGSPKRFNNAETVSRWTTLLASLMAETDLGVTDLEEFISWAVTENSNDTNPKLSSATFIPKSKDPCQTLCKHSMGSNPWLFATWDTQRRLAQKKSATAIAKAAAKSAAPEFSEGGVSSFDTYLDKLRAAKEAQYNYPEKAIKEKQ